MECVNTLLTDDIAAGTFMFSVHDDRGIMAGQILSIGVEGSDMEHVEVKCKGSVHLTAATANDHKRGLPVRLIMPTLRGRQHVAKIVQKRADNSLQVPGCGNQSVAPVDSPRAMSDIEFDSPDGECKGVVGKRDITFPYPTPIYHDDVLP